MDISEANTYLPEKNTQKLTAKEPKPTAPTNAANQPSTRFGSAIIVQVVRISCFDFFY